MQQAAISIPVPPRRTPYWWIAVVGVAWPGIPLAIMLILSGRLPPELARPALSFLLMGLLSGGGLVFLLRRAASRIRQWITIGGYLAAIPFASFYGIFSGLLLPPPLAPSLYGLPILLVGTLLGYAWGAVWETRSRSGGAGWPWLVASVLGLAATMALGVMVSIKFSAAVAHSLISSGIVPGQ